jgi:hypothetical protein
MMGSPSQPSQDAIGGGPNQLWPWAIACVQVMIDFVYVAAALDAWSCRVVSYAIVRSSNTGLMVGRQSPPLNGTGDY